MLQVLGMRGKECDGSSGVVRVSDSHGSVQWHGTRGESRKGWNAVRMWKRVRLCM